MACEPRSGRTLVDPVIGAGDRDRLFRCVVMALLTAFTRTWREEALLDSLPIPSD
jgi:hypothetical protein